ncbi:16803_t:CDS:2, partial [Acaulospora colombiana]
ASGFTPSHIEIFCKALENHLDWHHREHKSPFISTFRARRHAFRWAKRWDLVEDLDISVTLDPSQYHSEYLCLHRIPERVIVNRTRLQ